MARLRVKQVDQILECEYRQVGGRVFFSTGDMYGMGVDVMRQLYDVIDSSIDGTRLRLKPKKEQHYYAEESTGRVRLFRGATGMHFAEIYSIVFVTLFELVNNRFDVTARDGKVYDIGEDEYGEMKVFERMTDKVLGQISPREAAKEFLKGHREGKEIKDFLDMLIRAGEVDFEVCGVSKIQGMPDRKYTIRITKGTEAIGYRVVGFQEFYTRYSQYRCKNFEEVVEVLRKDLSVDRYSIEAKRIIA